MAKSLKVRKIGNSYGLILSKEILDELGVREGDSLFPVRTPDGLYLTPYDPDFEQCWNPPVTICAGTAMPYVSLPSADGVQVAHQGDGPGYTC